MCMSGFRAKVGRVCRDKAPLTTFAHFLFEKVHAGRKRDGGMTMVCVCVCVWRRRFLGVVWRCAWGMGEREGEVGKVGRVEMEWDGMGACGHVDMCH